MHQGNSKIKFNIDRGGTFTDFYVEYYDSYQSKQSLVYKLLSQDPNNYNDAPAEGIRRLIEKIENIKIGQGDKIPAKYIDVIRMGTTIATNALLEHKGERCALLITEGFKDLLEIGNQSRPDIFDLEIKKPKRIHDEVFEVKERVRLLTVKERDNVEELKKSKKIVMGTTGEYLEVIHEINEKQIEDYILKIKNMGIDSIAVAFVHSYAFREHEKIVKTIAKKHNVSNISLSSEIMPLIKFYPRGCTAVIDAYLTPAIHNYVTRFIAHFDSPDLNVLFMQSDGGMTNHKNFCGSKAILSGPAGGVVGYSVTTTDELGNDTPVIGFDMGGTSTDVSRYHNHWDHVFEVEIAGVSINSPQIDVNTVAAGGGSRLFFKNGLFLVGPESAGSEPGPVCYKKNGLLAITDANLILGRIVPKYFPKIFGKNADEELGYDLTRIEFERLAQEVFDYSGQKKSVEEIALGFISVANESMCKPIKALTQAKGYDPKEHILSIFGGAGGQHACSIANSLDIKRIYIHRYAGILSAYGLSMAEIVEEIQEHVDKNLTPDTQNTYVENTFNQLIQSAKDKLSESYTDEYEYAVTKYLLLRYEGNDYNISVPEPSDKDYKSAFEQYYKREYGFLLEKREIFIDCARVRVSLKPKALGDISKSSNAITNEIAEANDHTDVTYLVDNSVSKLKTGIYFLDKLIIGSIINGPAIILTGNSTIIIEPGWKCTITLKGNFSMEYNFKSDNDKVNDAGKDEEIKKEPIELSLFANRFMGIADQMGRHLQRTSVSTNIKERLDFSCAIFSNDGSLVANAPHLPVHLGAMQEAVKSQIKHLGDTWKPDDVILSNHPAVGGSHLPDMTVITPVYHNNEVAFYVANRGHHSDIGGLTPGSMPHLSKLLEDEGAAIYSHKLTKNGIFQEEETKYLFTEDLLNKGKPASRNLKDNISDLKAQVASNTKGLFLLKELIEKYGLKRVHSNMRYIQETAEESIRNMLKEFVHNKANSSNNTGDSNTHKVNTVDYMDDGSKICLTITVDKRDYSAHFDFTGTSPQVYSNTNTPKSVTYSAIIYCLRSMIHSDIPLNQGCLNPVKITIPDRCLLNPDQNCAVVGGNVLTSQRITDMILRAFKAAAASQGCMNNLTFGNDYLGYYETIGGGAGAGPTWHGKNGVQVHMTNTRITDVEILEKRYPVIIEAFSYREGSGGKGYYNGGEGLIRKYHFLENMTVSILSERRVFEPPGICGGGNGKVGINLYIKNNGQVFNVGGKNSIEANVGDSFCIFTPGGGAYGQENDTDLDSKKNKENYIDANSFCFDKVIGFGSVSQYYKNQYSV